MMLELQLSILVTAEVPDQSLHCPTESRTSQAHKWYNADSFMAQHQHHYLLSTLSLISCKRLVSSNTHQQFVIVIVGEMW